jgi:hypothetical protein
MSLKCLKLWAFWPGSLGRVNRLIVGPLSFSPSLVSQVPMVANLISSPRVLDKWTSVLEIQMFLVLVKLLSARCYLEYWPSIQQYWLSATKSILMWIGHWTGAPNRCSPILLYQIASRINSGVNLAITPNFNFFHRLTLKPNGQRLLGFIRSPSNLT